MMRIKIALLCFLLCANFTRANVLILSFYNNQPHLIASQYKLFQQYVTDDHTFVVVNCAHDRTMSHIIKSVCKKNQIRCLTAPSPYYNKPYPPFPTAPQHHPDVRWSISISYALDKLGFDHQGIVLLTTPAIIPIRPVSISTCMQGVTCVSLINSAQGLEFLHPAFTCIDMATLPDKKTLSFDFNDAHLTTGAFTYYYLLSHPEVRIQAIQPTSLEPVVNVRHHIPATAYNMTRYFSGAEFLLNKQFIHLKDII